MNINIKVKVYGVHDKNQGKLRKFIENNKRLSKYFPKLIAFDNKFIVEEWVEDDLFGLSHQPVPPCGSFRGTIQTGRPATRTESGRPHRGW